MRQSGGQCAAITGLHTQLWLRPSRLSATRKSAPHRGVDKEAKKKTATMSFAVSIFIVPSSLLRCSRQLGQGEADSRTISIFIVLNS